MTGEWAWDDVRGRIDSVTPESPGAPLDVWVRRGKTGTRGRTQKHSFQTAREAFAWLDRATAAQMKDGYRRK